MLVDRLEHMILPALTLGLVIFGEYTLIVRSAMLETLGEDYILTSRAKASRTGRRSGSAFRNALPVITLVALSLGFIIGGAITVEYVFSYPGSASSSSRRSTSATTRCCRRRSSCSRCR